MTQKFRAAKESKKRSFALTQQAYIAVGLPPKKQAPVQSSDVRTGTDADVLDKDDDTLEDLEGNRGEGNRERDSQRYDTQGGY